MASSEPNISAGILRHFRYSYYVTHWGKKVLFTILNFSFLRGQCKNILEILIDNGIPLRRIRRVTPLWYIKGLKDNLPEDLDISLIYLVFQLFWEQGVNDPGDELKGLIKKIKDERNMVRREQVEMSNIDLEFKLRDFQATLEETLDETKSLFPCYGEEIDQLKAEIQNAAPELLREIRAKYDPSNPMDLRMIQEEMEEFGSEFYEYIQMLSREELLFLYDCLCKVMPFDWLDQYGITDPYNIMVSLRMEENKDFHGHHRGKIVGQKEILLIRDPNGEVPEVVIISGDAGSGKTTILCSIVESWRKDTEDMAGLSFFNIVLYMQFRNYDHDNFDDYLRSLLPRTVAKFHLNHVKSSIISSKCVVLCDGYDEANENSKKLLRDILTLECQGMKIVVTTRPGNTEELACVVNKGGLVRINLRILGLRKQDLELLIERLLGYLVKEDVTKQEELKRELLQKINEMDTAISAILQTPLFFNLFVLLYIECPDLRSELSSRTLLYVQLKRHMAKRISSKIGVSCESLEEFDHLYEKWSLENYIQKKYEWSQTDVRRFKSEIVSREILQNIDAIMSSYFSIKLTKKNLDIEKVYCYTHKSMQEFAAAGVICGEIIASSGRPEGGNGNRFEYVLRSVGILRPDDERSGKVILTQELLEVIFYIPGILYSTERDILYNVIDDIHDLYVSAWALSLDKFIDDLLVPCAETGQDSKVLESLVSRLEETNAKNGIQISKTVCIFVLPSLLSILRPATIKLYNVPKNLSELNATLQVPNRHNIRTEFDLIMYLADFPEFSGLVSHPLDELRMDICSNEEKEEQDLESLCPISLEILAKELILNYQIQELSGDHLVQAINRTVPMNRPDDTTDLYVFLSTEHRMRRIIDLLTVRPLRYLTFDSPGTHGDSIEDLRRRCSEKGLGYLEIEYVGF